MSTSAPDLSRLRIDREQPSRGSRRALTFAVGLAFVAAVFVIGVLLVLRGRQALDVTVARAEVAGGGTATAVGITANGYVVARTKASVSSKITGRLEFLGVSEGSLVRRGEVMARLENRDYQAALAQAEAELLRAQAAHREAIRLHGVCDCHRRSFSPVRACLSGDQP